jgi:hypothetical protein
VEKTVLNYKNPSSNYIYRENCFTWETVLDQEDIFSPIMKKKLIYKRRNLLYGNYVGKDILHH